MLVLVQHLIAGGRYGRARTRELGRLLARYEAQPGPLLADPAARALAERIARVKRQLSEALAEVRACATCARGCVAPAGYFEGGRCCGTATLDVFTQAEVRAIKLAGVAPPIAPAEDGDERAGCLFRGSKGCSLEPEFRPARCLEYVCLELRVELEESEPADGSGAERLHVDSSEARSAGEPRRAVAQRSDRSNRIDALRRELSELLARFEAATR